MELAVIFFTANFVFKNIIRDNEVIRIKKEKSLIDST